MAYITQKAIRIKQPFGAFFLTTIKASELLKISFSDTFRTEDGEEKGIQRKLNDSRKKEIKEYIESVDCGFPNTIILAANYDPNGFLCDNNASWSFKLIDDDIYEIIIPTEKPLAAIIDGQHRVSGFKDCDINNYDMELACSIYFDLPSSLQAFLFATINSTQKTVNKSLAYELFGYELLEEEYDSWSPDKLAIAICRKLNSDLNSPFYEHVKTTAIQDTSLNKETWYISVAAVVDSILRLISSNPKKDKYNLHKEHIEDRTRGILSEDNSPLRSLYLKSRDEVIYRIIINYLTAMANSLPQWGKSNCALNKTIGVQGVFDVLRIYIEKELRSHKLLNDVDLLESTFLAFFAKTKNIDFSDDFFLKFSGVGRSRVRDIILLTWEIKSIADIKEEDREHFERLLANEK